MTASAPATQNSAVFVWRDPDFNPAAYSGVHAIAPILLGLSVPALAMLYVFPEMVAYGALLICVYLLAIFVIASVIFIRAVFNAQEVAEVRFDSRSKMLAITRKGSFGNTVAEFPFDMIADAYLRVSYDDDGYKSVVPEMRLKDGEVFGLPGDVTAAELEAVRRTIAKT